MATPVLRLSTALLAGLVRPLGLFVTAVARSATRFLCVPRVGSSSQSVGRLGRRQGRVLARATALLAVTLLALTPLALPSVASAQLPILENYTRFSDFDFYARGPYRDDVPRPIDVLGYETGTLHTPHLRMQLYFEALAQAAPERVRLETYGETLEKKRLFYAIISSEENLARVEEIRQTNLRLADPRETTPDEAARLAATSPIVVWLDYGNDGNETANLEAAIQVAYQLVAGDSEEMRRFREQAVIVLEPDHNPESHDRHVAWYNAFGIGAADPLAMEHHAPWGMSTNNNHYQIDLNRDAWALTQQENQAIAAALLRWRPQVFVDHHGQTENYFFAPPVRPINAMLPESHRHWFEAMGRGNAAAFDAEGWSYFVRDVYDLYYPGYWDSWPSLHGAIGMTYETSGGGSKGIAWRRQDGSLATFRRAIAQHYIASLATVRTAVDNREAILSDFYRFFADALAAGQRGEPFRAVVLDPRHDSRRAAVLAGTLLRHGIEVQRTTAPLRAEAREQETGDVVTHEFPAGSYLVDMGQPDQRVAQVFLQLDPPLDQRFIEEQFARWSRNARRGEDAAKEGYEFYDVTAWSLPVAFGVDAYLFSELPSVDAQPLNVPTEQLAGTGSWASEIPFELPTIAAAGDDATFAFSREANGPAAATREPPDTAQVAYAFGPHTEGALRLAARLLAEDYEIATSTLPLRIDGVEFPRGTFVVRVNRNPESIHQRIAELAADADVDVFAGQTGFPAQGQVGVGSNAVLGLESPRIAMIADEGIRITSYGAAWFTLEQRLAYPFIPIRFEQLRDADLSEFDVIVIGQGSTSTFERGFGEEGAERLARWVRDGGTLVGWGGGATDFAAEHELTTASLAGDTLEADSTAERNALAAIDSLPRAEAPRPPIVSPTADPVAIQAVPGANMRARLDLSHWLTFGYVERDMVVLVEGDDFLTLSENGSSPVVFPQEDELHVAGFIWPGNTERQLAGTAYAIAEPVGRGQVILFADDPNYRLVWRSTSRLFGNALLLGPTLGTSGL